MKDKTSHSGKLNRAGQPAKSPKGATVKQKRAEIKLHQYKRELRERRKELNCIYGISRIREKGGTLERIVKGIISLIPSSWQYPEITCARLVLGGQEFKTRNFRSTAYRQIGSIFAHNKKAGVLEICYLGKRPKSDEGPFLKAERYLLNVITERIGNVIEHKRAEEELKKSHRQLQELSEYLQTVREEERKSIAYKIHDELGQTLTGLKMDARWLGKRLPKTEETLLEKTQSMAELVDTAIQNVRKIAFELRPVLLDDFGITVSMFHHARELQKRSGVKFEVGFNPKNISLNKKLSTVVFRIFQELLTNIIRHANATNVKIKLEKANGELALTVSDNGRGITNDQLSSYKSFGLLSIRERVSFWGGRAGFRGIPNKGTTAIIHFPLNKQDELRENAP
ncbi:sensor histidine kinase [Elusimicrobiota bacterium]